MTPQEMLNQIANQPEVIAEVAPGHDNVDLSPLFRDGNYFCMDEKGAALFAHMGDDFYEGHYLYTVNRRGKDAKDFSRACIAAMFDIQGALAIIGHVPQENMACRSLTRALGFKPIGPSVDNFGRPCISYILERRRWVALSGV